MIGKLGKKIFINLKLAVNSRSLAENNLKLVTRIESISSMKNASEPAIWDFVHKIPRNRSGSKLAFSFHKKNQ